MQPQTDTTSQCNLCKTWRRLNRLRNWNYKLPRKSVKNEIKMTKYQRTDCWLSWQTFRQGKMKQQHRWIPIGKAIRSTQCKQQHCLNTWRNSSCTLQFQEQHSNTESDQTKQAVKLRTSLTRALIVGRIGKSTTWTRGHTIGT